MDHIPLTMAVILAVLAVGLAFADPRMKGRVLALAVCAVASALDGRIRRRNTGLAKLMWSVVMVLAFSMGLRYLNVETQAFLFAVWVALSVLRVPPEGKFTGGAELLRDFCISLFGCFALRYPRIETYALALAVWTPLLPFYRRLETLERDGPETASMEGGSSSSISTSAKKESRVFLSFNRGPDIPDVFIDFLMAQLTRSGISVFGDGKKLPEGEDLVGVIKRSGVSIPIISKGYASSGGCLVELGVMLECKRTDGQTIIPIFYEVDPSDVRHVRGSFEMSLKDHEMKGTDGRTINAWGRALREVGGLERFYSADDNSWSSFKLLKQLHLDVLQLFGKQDIKENLVGIQDRVQEVMTKLGVYYKDGQSIGLHGGDVRVVGIYGACGVGKTTLAKAVYKDIASLFDGCSYLEDIQERFTQSEGLKSLQNQLISDLLKRSCPMFTCEEGAHIIRHRFHSTRVLIILDDVNYHHQLEPFIGMLSWFGPRSRIIVTTRDYGLINIPEVAERYEVEPLKPDQALLLFRRHASNGLQFPEGYDSLFDEIISVTGRIPLAIEVLAPILCRMPTKLWHKISKILRVLDDPVEGMLTASFVCLNDKTKEMLLDIACFFVGKDIAKPFFMWCACGYDPLSGIKVLLDMSLVQIGENNKLWMHDEMRNLCQQFVCNGDPKSPERHSRLWNYEDAVSLLKERKGTKLVEALNLKFDNSSHDCFTCEEFELLPDLRFLKLGKARIIGDSKNALSNLRWLDWQGCPETFGACDLHLKELVILDLSWSKVAHDWKGWSQIKMPQLKILNLKECAGLLMTPDLSGFEKLEILILEHCSRLVNIAASIAQLKCLVTLNLKFCTELSMLPKELNDMKEMRELLIDGTSIKEIPSALANMKKLKILSASNCFSLSGLPESIGQLEALSVLLLDSAKIVELPDSIGELVQLKQLSLRNCRCLGELPDSIGKLGSTLFELDVSGTGISKLPASIRNLRSLKVLKMDSCFIREFPHDIGRLTNLEEMHALRCRSLEGDIPSDIGELKSLRTLVLGYTRISSLPPCIQSLCCLQTLDLLHCDRIEALPILPSSLTHLHVISRNMKVVPFIDNLTKLEELCLGDEDFEEIKLPSKQRVMNFILTRVGVLSFHWPKRFSRLKLLELSHSRITDLCLRDEHLPQLTKLVVSGANLKRILQLPLTLSFLSVRGCLSLKRLPTVQCLKGLTELQLSHSAVREVEGLGKLGALEIIDISHCEIRNLEGLGQLTSLISLTLSDCDHLRELPNISNLKMLKILEIRRCREIKNIQGLQEIRSSLEKLHVGERKDEDSPEEAVEDKDLQGDCGPGSLPQCPQQPEKHAEHKLLPHGQVQVQHIVLGHEPSPPQRRPPEPAVVLDDRPGEATVEPPHFLHPLWGSSGSASPPFSSSASASAPSAPPQAEEEEQFDSAEDEEPEGQEVEVEEEEEDDEQSLDDVYRQVKRTKFGTEQASSEILPEPSVSVMPAFVHFEDDDIVETHWPATGRKGKGKASNKVEEEIDTRADEFINRFRQHLKLHRPNSIIRFEEMLNRGCSSASPPHFEEDDIVEARLLATERKGKRKASDEVEEQELHARADDFIKRLSRRLRAGAMLAGSTLVSVLAYKFVKNRKKNTCRKADDPGASSSRTTSAGSNHYDVFLSFCGMDVRYKFGDHLYTSLVKAGIWVFRDNDKLSEGDDIGTSLYQAIKNSKIFIPILSQNYGSRKWCLQELVEMIKHMENGGHIVLPIFYEVEPAHVRYQKGDFGTAFSQFSKNYIVDDIEKWKHALQKVGSLKGWEVKRIANSSEGKLLELVVTRVSRELSAMQMDDIEQPVGIDDVVEDILRLLDNKPCATQIIGIHGMGGIGKTTLAKVVYSKLSNQFRDRSFLEDIRESYKGKFFLQNQLISDILNTKDLVSNTCDANNFMASRFKYKKVLIILDGVEDQNKLSDLFRKEWFMMGSRVIITTRNRSVLEHFEVNYEYKVEEIDADQSLILFSRHAFRRDSPPCEFESLTSAVVSTTGGLPLALKVIGSLLRGKEEGFWQDTLEKLRKVPIEEVQEKLRISFEALSDEGKEIFLDIACFLIGTDLRIASYMWHARDLHPRMEILILSSMSLITIGDNHVLKMHDQLRNLGKKIASQGEPKERSRLWVFDEALDVLHEDKNNKIKALRLDKDDSSKFLEQESFKRLPNLQFLHLSEVDFSGDFRESLSKLRWLKWEKCPGSFEATNVGLEKLLILDLSGGFISQKWGGWRLIKMNGLKVLNLSGCSNLTSTPDLSSFRSLEMLTLENCENLEEIDPSIKEVKFLVSLKLRRCGSLKKLPKQLGELENLEELLLDETDIREIPPSIGSLEKLKMLSAVGCRLLTRIPSSIICLVSLLALNLNTCKKLQELPNSFEACGKLQRLSLQRCYMLKEIPSSIGKLGDLVELDLSSTKIKELPESISELYKLKILRISHSEIEKLPMAIGKLKSLQELDASGCHKLEGQIPVDEGGLSSLRTLRLGRAKISRLPENFHELSNLDHLDLLYCSELQSPQNFPSRLSSLHLTCRGHELPSLSQLSYLKELTLCSCMSLQSIPELPFCIRKLRVWKCPKLERLPSLSKLNSLSDLELLQCYGLKKLDGLEALKSLRKLDLSTSTELSRLNDFEDLESLRYLDLQSYDGKVDHLHAIGGLGQLKSLEVLNISARKYIQQLNLSNSKDLKQLIVNNCKSLDKICFHENIKSLERFDTDGCKSHIKHSLAHDRT